MTKFIPLISPKPFAKFTPEEFRAYVRSLHQAPPRPSDYTASITKKGTLTLRIRRDPKYLTSEEIRKIAEQTGLPLIAVRDNALKKKIEVRDESPGESKDKADSSGTSAGTCPPAR